MSRLCISFLFLIFLSTCAEWASAPLPPARRAYGLHLNVATIKGKEKLCYGHGRFAIIRDLEDLSQHEAYPGHLVKVNVVSVSPNGSWVVSGDEGGNTKVWGYPNQIVKSELRIGQCINDARWTADSSKIVAGGNGNQEYVKAFRYDTPNALGKIDRLTSQVRTYRTQ